MQRITALIHTQNDGLRIGRCLETLYPCDEILVVDHGSQDDSVRVAKEYAAQVVSAPNRAPLEGYLRAAEWILCLDARESLTESLAASLYEWKLETSWKRSAFNMFVREETAEGWVASSTPETRLVPGDWKQWVGHRPENDPSAVALEGEVLRFTLP